MLAHGEDGCSCEDEEQLQVQKSTFLVQGDEVSHIKEE